ncbi:CAZyme family GH18 [Paecilomyces variotii]|nr:CAZyme family GH18 [Paecilomyces variotii]
MAFSRASCWPCGHGRLFSFVLLALLAVSDASPVYSYSSAQSRCPDACSVLGSDPAGWTQYHSLDVLAICNQTVLFDMNLYNPVDDPQRHITIRACTAAVDGRVKATATGRADALSWGNLDSDIDIDSDSDTSILTTQLAAYVQSNPWVSSLLASGGGAVAGIYIGPGIDVSSAVDVVRQSKPHAQTVQYCGTDNSQFFGIVLDTQGNISSVQAALATWASGHCLADRNSSNSSSSSNAKIKLLPVKPVRSSSIAPVPQPYANGTCYTYTVQANDTCASIATAHKESYTVIEQNNNNTWGWMGCSDLLVGQRICLSPGNPHFPATVSNAVCGPQVNDTTPTANYTGWPDLNPCPINACCDIWGQCGITSDFCTAAPADTGAPGTAQPGSNGCISNCGFDVIESAGPDEFFTVGYFEAWNLDRPCLHMYPSDIPSRYSHVHFAFANISDDYTVSLGDYEDFFSEWQSQRGFKHILSFGGWGFSTSPQTYPIFRSGVTAAERTTFASNLVQFIKDNNLDGIDFDWEYPGATDIPGIPAGSAEDGANYLAFLQEIRARLPTDQYSVSIAAPASYWYLRNFPIQEIGELVDYIVYMTYDFHGQWDYSNSYSDPGCPDGNCLRSQVNKTETLSALSMITKAGVPSNKIMVGMPLYGRSFEMTEAGCYTQMCTYVGPDSGATPGMCTATAGYISNWEIQQILNTPGNDVQQYYSDEAGDIVVYNGTQWVSYLTNATYSNRVSWVQGMNFGGISDWAMDLETSYYSNGTEEGGGSGVVFIDPGIFTETDPTIACIPPCTFVLPPWTLSTPTTISQPPVTQTLQQMWQSTVTDSSGVTSVVVLSTTTVTTITVPPVTTETIDVYNVVWTDIEETIIYFTSSVYMPSIVLTGATNPVSSASSASSASSTTSSTIAGILYTYSPGPYTGPSAASTTTNTPNPPPPKHIGSVHVTKGPPSPTCTRHCGSRCHINCVPSLPCTGICGCIGHSCPGGGRCVGDGCGGDDDNDSGGGGDDGHDNTSTSCSTTRTYTNCEVPCSVTNYGTSATTTCSSATCEKTSGCQASGTTTTAYNTTYNCYWTTVLQDAYWTVANPAGDPPRLGAGGQFGYTYITGTGAVSQTSSAAASYIPCTYQGQDPDQGITAQYCVCSGSTFAPQTTSVDPGNSCAYTALPAETTSVGMNYETITSNCNVCTWLGQSQVGCTKLGDCTSITQVTSTATVTVTPTQTVVVTPAEMADCVFRDVAVAWAFEIYNIQNWATDGGKALHKQEDGCGALTGWKWHEATDTELAHVYFNLPYFIKDGCVERAIVSAGGPKLSCQGLEGGMATDDEDDYDDNLPVDDVDAEELLRPAKRSQTLDTPVPPRSLSLPYSYSSNKSGYTYTPMSWPSDNGTVTLTWTSTQTTAVMVTLTSVIPKSSTTSSLASTSSAMPGWTASRASKASSTPFSASRSASKTTSSGTKVSTPSPIQTGMVSDCDDFHLVVTNDTCASVADVAGISLSDFYAWNPAVGSKCLYLALGDYVCIGVSSGSNQSVTTKK